MALRAINEGGPIFGESGEMRQFRPRVNYANHGEQLREILDEALEQGVAGKVIETGWVVSAVRFPGWPKGTDIGQVIHAWIERRDSLLDEAGLRGVPAYRLKTTDVVGRLAKCPPYSLYGLSPRLAAFLTCDWLIVESQLSVPWLVDQLRDAGAMVVNQGGDPAVLQASKGDHSITITRSNTEHVLLEMVETAVYAKAISDWLDEPGFQGLGELVLPTG
jgi:hypothetical protein